MQALMNFKNESHDSVVGNEDIKEEIKETLKTFHSNLLILQQVIGVCVLFYKTKKSCKKIL